MDVSSINESTKLSTYALYKQLIVPESYVLTVSNFWKRKQMAKFRTSNHDLAIEKGRHNRTPRELRLCKLCNLGQVEDEYHFAMICPKYQHLRVEHLPKKFHNFPSREKFIELMSTKNEGLVLTFTHFIYEAFKIRKRILVI